MEEEKRIDVRLVIGPGDPLYEKFEWLKKDQGLLSNAEVVRTVLARYYDMRTR